MVAMRHVLLDTLLFSHHVASLLTAPPNLKIACSPEKKNREKQFRTGQIKETSYLCSVVVKFSKNGIVNT